MEFPEFPRLIENKINYYIWRSNRRVIKKLNIKLNLVTKVVDHWLDVCYSSQYPENLEFCSACMIPFINDKNNNNCNYCCNYCFCDVCIDINDFKKCIDCGTNICKECWKECITKNELQENICYNCKYLK